MQRPLEQYTDREMFDELIFRQNQDINENGLEPLEKTFITRLNKFIEHEFSKDRDKIDWFLIVAEKAEE